MDICIRQNNKKDPLGTNLGSRGFAKRIWVLAYSVRWGTLQIGVKTSYRPLGATTGMMFSKNGYPNLGLTKPILVVQTNGKQRSDKGTLLVRTTTRGRHDFEHKATK